MAYFLRIHHRKKGDYLQIVESFRNKEKKETSHKSFKTLGYVSDLISSDIPDPISFYKDYVKKLNSNISSLKEKKISDCSSQYNVGHFLLKSFIDKLNVDKTIEILSLKRDFQFDLNVLIRQLIYSQVVAPCSKSKTVSKIFSSLYDSTTISEDQVYDGINFIGSNYKKYIELFNHNYQTNYKRKVDTLFFDCTNYYFEIDMASEDKQKGPSKENRKEPIIGQALLLDSNQIPIGMEMYPGNESEKPYIRKLVNEMKERFNVTGKTVQVADKGLNCAKNIIEAIKNGDGYVFSKSIHGKNLNDIEKKWILLPNDYVDVLDSNGKVNYKVKECIDVFVYKLDGKQYKIKEKRIVSYNKDLARKQQAEIRKQIDKIESLTAIKTIKRDEYGDSVKYVNFEGDTKATLNYDKVKEDMELAGYNLIVTSELSKSALEIYDIYHGLWRIEESFRITKSYLDARPVYLQKKESIYGHFLICYLSLFILRCLEFHIFESKLNVCNIIDFIRDYTITKNINNTFINNAIASETLKVIKKTLEIEKLDNLYFSKSDIEKVYQTKV